MDGVRIVEIDGLPGEVTAIVKTNIKVTFVDPGIELLNERVVLCRAGFYAKGIAGPVVSGAYQLHPIVGWRAAVLLVGCNLPKIASPVFVPQVHNVFHARAQRNLISPIDGIEVRQQRDRDPIVSADAIIAADHNALLSGVASP